MLPIYFFVARITRNVPIWIVFPIACLLQMFPPIHFNIDILDKFGARYVFFYAGYAFAKWFFIVADKVSRNCVLSLSVLVVWALVNSCLVFTGYSKHLPVTLGLGFAGAIAVISVASLLQQVNGMGWLKYLGENSIAIYLPFYWVMMFVSYVVTSIYSSPNADYFTILITIFSIAGSLFIYWSAKYLSPGNWLFSRPQWLRNSS
jgi:uncharacterized membrane protein YcfT